MRPKGIQPASAAGSAREAAGHAQPVRRSLAGFSFILIAGNCLDAPTRTLAGIALEPRSADIGGNMLLMPLHAPMLPHRAAPTCLLKSHVPG